MHPPSSPNDTPDVSANGDVVARYTSPISGRPDLSPTDQGPYNLYLSTCPPEAVYCYELQSTKLAQLISTYSARAVWRSRLSKLTAPTLAISDLESYHSAVKLLKTRPTLPPGWILPNKHARRHHSDITTRVGGAEKDNMPLVLECAMTGKLCNELQKVEGE
ncbi:hypothetical protein P7C70_g4117, partial [Phenoliferia sp. Uapishka_3]